MFNAMARATPANAPGWRDETGGSVYLRLTTNPIEQPGKRHDDAFRQGAIDGAYWLRKAGSENPVMWSSLTRGPSLRKRSRRPA